ncbi:D-aminoacyl-tRNA deacylase [Chloroflexota bacterium]
MKVLLQRVTGASVSVLMETVGRIGTGLVGFVGIADGDTEEEVQYLVTKMVKLRIFSDTSGNFNLSILEIKGELLLVSQFTLLADTRRGRRPSFTKAAELSGAKYLFEYFVEQARATGLKVETGRFQKYMQVEIKNDGPVTIMLDSQENC